jgi:hypothetical protein
MNTAEAEVAAAADALIAAFAENRLAVHEHLSPAVEL